MPSLSLKHLEEKKTCPMELDVYQKIQKLLQSGFSWKMQFIRMDGNKITNELSKLKAPSLSIFKQSLPGPFSVCTGIKSYQA